MSKPSESSTRRGKSRVTSSDLFGGGSCEWAEDADGSAWETSCHNRFLLNDGGPTDNGLKFCPFCGKALVELDGWTDGGCTPIVPDGSPGLGPNNSLEQRAKDAGQKP